MRPRAGRPYPEPEVPPAAAPRVVAALGPTNTGKTHRAIERMLEHASGMIGLPLRLLAREVYDRVSAKVGENAVALVTGEEKRIPESPRYWVCTVEAMPIERTVDFLAVDEIQMSAHVERGHVFTDRLLHARGRRETWLMGAETVGELLREHVPNLVLRRFPRLSELRSAGQLTLGTLPPRSAIVSFSMEGVYRLAERLRARRGGAAVVLGALSPRARNAQVALFQAGEVDFLVATDAIGMGLNLELRHVSFAEQRKFDGRTTRPLSTAELAQIAGRAGRYREDGSFSTLAPAQPLSHHTERALERHAFAREERLVWRNSDLDFSSLEALSHSLSVRPEKATLDLVKDAEDFNVLRALMGRDAIRALASDEASVRLFWEVCQIPDYQSLFLDHHANLVLDVFTQLRRNGELDAEWLRRGIGRLDDTRGDVDDLIARMAFVRTWTYITHHRAWVPDSAAWQESTREIEDRLSDALHERLVERFVKVGRKSFPFGGNGNGSPKNTGNPFVDMLRAKLKESTPETPSWTEQLIEAPHAAFHVDAEGRIFASDVHIASLKRGIDIVHPEVVLQRQGGIGAGAASRLKRRLAAWAQDLVTELVGPLREIGSNATPALRGLLYQLEHGLGTLSRAEAASELAALGEGEHTQLAQAGVKVGSRFLYVTRLLEPWAVRSRWALTIAHAGHPELGIAWGDTRASEERVRGVSEGIYLRAGFPVVAARAIRADLIEEVQRMLPPPGVRLSEQKLLELSAALTCPPRRLPAILHALGYRPNEIRAENAANSAGREAKRRRRRRRRRGAGSRGPTQEPPRDS